MTFDIEKQYYDICDGDNVIVKRIGSVSADLITETLLQTEQVLLKKENLTKMRKKVYNVLVEALQNLYHHALNVPSNIKKYAGVERFAIFALKKDAHYYFISGNFILSETVSTLTKNLEKINKQTPEQLKTMYKEILANNKFSKKGGGGLGFIDMARRAKSKFKYSFTKVDEKYSFFSLRVDIINL